ncbi:MAG: hypothetical protein IPL43_09865 [Micropruina sp.]|nr:hypothetical protein [Micropruina sp.]
MASLVAFVGTPLAMVISFFIWANGGIYSILPAPDQDKPEVVADRAVARAKAAAALGDLQGSTVLSLGPTSSSAGCLRGQNNMKVQTGYLHECHVTAAQFYGWTGTFPSMARVLHKELTASGWKVAEYEDGLPRLADQYETGRNPNRGPGAPVVIDFYQVAWQSCYTMGDDRMCFRFVDGNSSASMPGYLDLMQNRTTGGDWSYSEYTDTVSSKATVDRLLQHADGVVFASSEAPYYTSRS